MQHFILPGFLACAYFILENRCFEKATSPHLVALACGNWPSVWLYWQRQRNNMGLEISYSYSTKGQALGNMVLLILSTLMSTSHFEIEKCDVNFQSFLKRE